MRVLFVVGAFPNLPCGVGDYTFFLTRELSKSGLEVYVLTSRSQDIITNDQELSGVQVHAVVPSWDLSSIPLLIQEIRRISPDIVHIQYPANFGKANRKLLANLLGIVAKWATKNKARVITTLHEFGERSLRWRARTLLNVLTSDLMICVNSFDVRVLEKWTRRIVVHVPIASSIPRVFISSDQKLKIREVMGVSNSDLMVVYFGFITPLKGFDVLVRAIIKLKTKGWHGKLVILTALDTETQPYHREMIELIDTFGVRNDFVFQKKYYSKEEISMYLQSADLAVLPFVEGASERRSSLLAVLQNGLSAITTTGPNLPANFEHRLNMFLVSPGDSDAIAQAIFELSLDPDLRLSIAQGAKILAEKFSWGAIVKQTIQIYEQVLC